MPRPARRRRLALALLVVVSLTFVTLDYRMSGGSAFSGLRSAAGTVAGTMQRALSDVVSPVGRFVSRIGGGGGSAGTANGPLAKENDRLRRELHDSQLDRATLAELRKLDLLAGAGGYRIAPGRVIALGPSAGLEWTAVIDVGTRDGVAVGMTVVNGDGLVGRIKRALADTSVVLMVVDPVSSVGARLEGSRQLGLCTGDGAHRLRLQLLDPQARVAPGDRLVTGPWGQTTYAAGVPIGTVTKVSGASGALVREAEVRPYVNFTALDIVGVVITAARTDPRDSVLPPKPGRR
ncbi:MAG: rod shape-determining protein MreC [Actinomycetota bacterium]|nr:rod shape-determining protein MreC [Actinomycetota bacterium]